MLRGAPSLAALALLFAAAPALAQEAPPSRGAPPAPSVAAPPAGYVYPAPPPYAYPPAPAPPAFERRSLGAIVSGIVLVSVAVTGLAVGTGLYVDGTRSCGGSSFFPDPSTSNLDQLDCSSHVAQLTGMAFLVGSSLVLGGGVSLWIYGAQQVPKGSQEAARPRLLVGPRSASLRWSF